MKLMNFEDFEHNTVSNLLRQVDFSTTLFIKTHFESNEDEMKTKRMLVDLRDYVNNYEYKGD